MKLCRMFFAYRELAPADAEIVVRQAERLAKGNRKYNTSLSDRSDLRMLHETLQEVYDALNYAGRELIRIEARLIELEKEGKA